MFVRLKKYNLVGYVLLLSTAVEQAVVCAPVTQRARFRSPVGTGFQGKDFFWGSFLTSRQMS